MEITNKEPIIINGKEVLEVNLSNLPEGINVDEFLKEFKESWGEWAQSNMNKFIESKIKIK